MDGDRRDQVREGLRRKAPPDRVVVDGVSYPVVGDEERVDREWEDAEAERRRREWQDRQDERLAERQAARGEMTLGQRLDQAMLELERGRGTRARPIMSGRGGRGAGAGARPADAAGSEVADRALRLIAHHLSVVERELDAELGLVREQPRTANGKLLAGATGGVGDGRLMSTEERDRIVFDDFVGVRAEQVAAEAPYLGTSARTIERARAAEARRRGVRVRQVDGVVLGTVDDGKVRRVRVS